MKVSFIIPFYNSKEYLEGCIRSLMRIKNSDIEFLFIDDGSEDKGKEIIQKYQKIEKRMNVYSQNNQGVSAARNFGIQKAKGEWISFIDSDDTIEAEAYDMAIDSLRDDMDLFIMGFDIVSENKQIQKKKEEISIYSYDKSDLQKIRYGIIDRDFKLYKPYRYRETHIDFAGPCGKFYRHRIIEKYKIFFPVGITIGEDRIFNYKYCGLISKCFYSNNIAYHYFQNEESAMHQFKEGKGRDVICLVNEFQKTIEDDLISKKCLWQLGIRYYLVSLKMEFCNLNNQKCYRVRRKEALDVRKMDLVNQCFHYGSIWKIRIEAIPLALFAKYKMFFICDMMLKLKEFFHITASI
ncbi:MAG: glycosyltransferase family 2 protein [Lachnospiraceae bacterium]|nr:glycosyltransferase family 2 protein [Lachnospiraceae bacterium]